VDIKQLSPASRRQASAVPAADDSWPSDRQLSPARYNGRPVTNEENHSNHNGILPRNCLNNDAEHWEMWHPSAVNHTTERTVSRAAGPNSANPQSRTGGATVCQQSGIGNGAVSGRRYAGGLANGAVSGGGPAAPSPPGTKIVFLSKEGNILAESRTAAASPPFWHRSRETGPRPPLEASSSFGSYGVEDELVAEVAARLDLWRSLNGSPTYPLPPYEPLQLAGKTATPESLFPKGRLANGGPKLSSGMSASGAARTAVFSTSRQSTEESVLPAEGQDLMMRAVQGGRAAVNGGQKELGVGRPQLARQTRLSDDPARF